MSYDASYYIGVYLDVKPRTLKREIKAYICAGFTVSYPFNPITGEKLQETLFIKEERETVTSWIEKLDDYDTTGLTEYEFSDFYYHSGPENHVYTGNENIYFILNVHNPKYLNEIEHTINIDKIDSEKIINDFMIDYKRYLDYYRHRGYDFEVKYGIFHVSS
jgi:hypothetical protein